MKKLQILDGTGHGELSWSGAAPPDVLAAFTERQAEGWSALADGTYIDDLDKAPDDVEIVMVRPLVGG